MQRQLNSPYKQRLHCVQRGRFNNRETSFELKYEVNMGNIFYVFFLAITIIVKFLHQRSDIENVGQRRR